MTYSNPEVIEPIRSLKSDYLKDIESSWFKGFKLWFFPSAVKEALEPVAINQGSMDKKQVRMVYDALMNHTWFFQRWLFSCHRNVFNHAFCNEMQGFNTKSLLTEYYFQLIATHNSPAAMASALNWLSSANLLTPANGAALHKINITPDGFKALFKLNSQAQQLLNQANFDAIMNHSDPNMLRMALQCLWDRGIRASKRYITQNNFNKMIALRTPMNIIYALEACTPELQNSQVILDFLFQHKEILLNNDVQWVRIPSQSLTRESFNAIRLLCEDNTLTIETRQRNFANYINRIILDIAPDNNGQQPLNGGQSTHTASVHASVSASASKLAARYGLQNLEKALEQLCTFVNSLSDNNAKHKAAKACILRITAPGYTFVDPGSQLATRQLLGLVWLAISDNFVRQGTLEDARSQLIEGLYEIQRGYNLSAKNVDNKQEDVPICLAGTFNKLVEKLASIHPDCTILNITKGFAALKLPRVVKEEAIKYLSECAKVQTAEGQLAFTNLVDKIKKEGGAIIWDAIKKAVSERMFSEYGSLYKHNKEDKDFNEFIACGELCKELTDDVPAFLQTLQSSEKPQAPGRSGLFSLSDSSGKPLDTTAQVTAQP